jgi:hypothetical protein
MSKFKIGDRVRVTKPFQAMQLVGAKAVVVVLEKGGWYGLDIEGWTHGHNCLVLGEGCISGYWVKEGYFEKVSTFKGNK